MALVFEQFLTAAIGDAAYLVGDDSAGVAAVIDPQLDTAHYLERARAHGVSVRYVLQTHIHEDFLSGAAALAAAAGGAELCLSGHDAPTYGFPHHRVHDGDVLELGSLRLTVRHTPGHTPEHIALVLADSGDDEPPFAVFSGGALLVGAAGRTDLLGPERADELSAKQFKTLHEVFLALPDGVQVYPTHVHGSPCGAAIGDKLSTTIAHERAHNPLLQPRDEAGFKAKALDNLPPKPRYYPRLKERNTHGQPTGGTPPVPALPPDEFARALRNREAVLVDTRHVLAFGGGHIPGALNIGAAGHLAIWAGWMLDPDKPILLVLEHDSALTKVLAEFARTGFERFAGYLAGGMTAWQSAGQPLVGLRLLPVQQIAREREQRSLTVLDVRSPQEWQSGHIPGARHAFLPDLPERIASLDRGQPHAVYCDSGYRASLAASLLQSHGFDVANVPGSWQAWKANDLPVQRPDGGG